MNFIPRNHFNNCINFFNISVICSVITKQVAVLISISNKCVFVQSSKKSSTVLKAFVTEINTISVNPCQNIMYTSRQVCEQPDLRPQSSSVIVTIVKCCVFSLVKWYFTLFRYIKLYSPQKQLTNITIMSCLMCVGCSLGFCLLTQQSEMTLSPAAITQTQCNNISTGIQSLCPQLAHRLEMESFGSLWLSKHMPVSRILLEGIFKSVSRLAYNDKE